MLLHPSSFSSHNPSLSSTLSYSHSFHSKPRLLLRHHLTLNTPKHPTTTTTTTRTITTTIIACSSVPQAHNYGSVDYERRPMVKWNSVYKRISLMENPELGAASVLNKCEDEGKHLTKWELCRVVRELRRFKRHKQALEVYEWMNNREERFRLSASDAAIQLDLIAKVRGVASADDYFLQLPNMLKDRRIYGALLNAYVRAKQRDKAESLMNIMREKGYAAHALPFNVMMTLYMNLKEYDKVDSLVSEMKEKNIQLDMYSYNIWLSSRGSQDSVERMEEVFEQMKLDKTINPNWTTFSTLATMYIKMGEMEKAEESLRRVESRITGRDRIPYHYLISLYGTVGNKEEVYRIWNSYKTIFRSIPNLGYHAVISSLTRTGDIEGAEKLYDEWLSVRTSFDPRIGNLLMSWYVKEGNLDKAENILDHMIEVGGKPTSSTWEILAEGHMAEKRISEALSCLKEAFSADGSKSWRPKALNIPAFMELCEKQGDMPSKEAIVGLLKQSGFLKDKAYASLIGLPLDASYNNDILGEPSDDGKISDNDEVEEDRSDILLNHL